MEKKHAILIFLVTSVVLSAFLIIIANIDLWVNSWLLRVANGWKFGNYFSSRHALSILYLKGEYWTIIAASLLFSAVATLLLYRISKR